MVPAVIYKARHKVWQDVLNFADGMPIPLPLTVIHLIRMAY